MTNLLVTVGDSPLPVILTILGLQPQHVAFIVDDSSGPVSPKMCVSAILEAAEELGHAVSSHTVSEVPRYLEAEIARAVDDAFLKQEGPWHLGYSAGSPTMAMTALQRWSRESEASSAQGRKSPALAVDAGAGGTAACSDSPNAWYVKGDRLVAPDGAEREVSLSGQVGLATVLKLHGWQVTKAPAVPQPSRRELQDAQRALGQLPESALASEVGRLNATLEKDLRVVLRDVLPKDFIFLGPVKARRGEDRLTLDAVAVRGLSLVAFGSSGYLKCGRGDAHPAGRVEDRKEDAFALHLQATVLGGLQARSVFIVQQSGGSAAVRCPGAGSSGGDVVELIRKDLDNRGFPRQRQLIMLSDQRGLDLLKMWLEVVS